MSSLFLTKDELRELTGYPRVRQLTIGAVARSIASL